MKRTVSLVSVTVMHGLGEFKSGRKPAGASAEEDQLSGGSWRNRMQRSRNLTDPSQSASIPQGMDEQCTLHPASPAVTQQSIAKEPYVNPGRKQGQSEAETRIRCSESSSTPRPLARAWTAAFSMLKPSESETEISSALLGLHSRSCSVENAETSAS